MANISRFVRGVFVMDGRFPEGRLHLRLTQYDRRNKNSTSGLKKMSIHTPLWNHIPNHNQRQCNRTQQQAGGEKQGFAYRCQPLRTTDPIPSLLAMKPEAKLFAADSGECAHEVNLILYSRDSQQKHPFHDARRQRLAWHYTRHAGR
jgi:hypothetical protein